MKRPIILALSIFLAFSWVSGQKQAEDNSTPNAYDGTFAQLHYWEYNLNNAKDTALIKGLIKRELNLNEDDELRVVSINTSLTATHITFKQYYNGVEVLGGGAKVAVSQNNVLFRCIETLFPTNGTLPAISATSKTVDLSAYKNPQVLESKGVYVWTGDQLQPGWYTHFLHDEVGDVEKVWLADGTEYFTRDLNRYLAGPDSTVTMHVFHPDPITPINKIYGGVYVDINDGNASNLDPQQVTVQMKTEFDSGFFHLRSDYVEITEHSSPVKSITKSSSPSFIFSRTDDDFEQVNAYYHIMNFQFYLRDLGYNLVNYAIHVDANGFGGQDNSAFTPSTNPPRLTFGEGGVDDAEDADVVIHEYGHAISESAAPLTNNGMERRCLDEAFGDYLAVSYTKQEYSFGSDRVFNWDGHNPFWNGRTVNNPSNFCYDNVTFNDIYSYTTLFNAAMFDIWDQLGKTYTDKLMIEALHGYYQNMSFRDAAMLVVDADAALANSANDWLIWQAFDQYCILDWSDLEEARGMEAKPYSLRNTMLTANKNLLIELKPGINEGTVRIFDLSGRLLNEAELIEGLNEVTTVSDQNGMLLVQIEIANQVFSEKVVMIK